MTDGVADSTTDAVRRPWLPAPLVEAGLTHDTVTALSYLAVDEIVDDTVTLTVSPWPAADSTGRVRFDDVSAKGTVGTTVETLTKVFYRQGPHAAARPPHIGDVFGARLSAAARRRLDHDGPPAGRPLRRIVAGQVYDLSAEAREAAKLAFFAAAAPVLDEDSARERGLDDADDTQLAAELAVPAVAVHEAPRLPRGADPTDLPAELVAAADGDAFLAACRARDGSSLVYFLLNVGDGDTQVLLLPADQHGRRVVVVDAATMRKVPRLLDALREEGVLPEDPPRHLLPLVVATHPHSDHIGGLRELLDLYDGSILEFWEPGYYHPSDVYIETMVALEDRRGSIRHLQPTSGLSCYLGEVRLTVLAPGIVLRNRFDSFGTRINDASLGLKIDYPITRVTLRPSDSGQPVDEGHRNRRYVRNNPWTLLLGADAQTTAWAQTTLDFPEVLGHANAALAEELRLGSRRETIRDPLRADVFKVSHHASKHGINLELVSRINPSLSLVSSSRGGRHGFPHALALEALREARFAIATRQRPRPPDYGLGIHYTCAHAVGAGDDGSGQPLGSMAVVVPATRGAALQLWRFGDERAQPVDLRRARRVSLS